LPNRGTTNAKSNPKQCYVTKAARICVFVFEINEEWVVGIPSEDNNTFCDLSAILIENMPIWAEFSSTPSNNFFDERMETKLLRLSTKLK
jgi:hypothetical protein